jgi:hypothetical protein
MADPGRGCHEVWQQVKMQSGCTVLETADFNLLGGPELKNSIRKKKKLPGPHELDLVGIVSRKGLSGRGTGLVIMNNS